MNLIDSIVQEHFERQYIEDPLARIMMFSKGLDCIDHEKGEFFLCEDNGLEFCPIMVLGQWTPLLSL